MKNYFAKNIQPLNEELGQLLEPRRWKPYDKKHHKFEEYEAHED